MLQKRGDSHTGGCGALSDRESARSIHTLCKQDSGLSKTVRGENSFAYRCAQHWYV